jgi:hypothetical protein
MIFGVNVKHKNKKYQKPISLYPLKLNEVLKAIMKIGDEKIKKDLKKR